MNKYSEEIIKKLHQEILRIRNEATTKANDLWDEKDQKGPYPQEIISKAMENAWNSYFSKLEEIYPGCLSSGEFANFFVENGYELNEYHKVPFAKRFSGEGRAKLIESFDFYDYFEYYGDTSLQSWKTLEKDIENGLTGKEHRELGLDSDDTWFSITAAELPIVDEEGAECVKGFRISVEENEYDEDGNAQAFSGPVGIFVPLNDFGKARIDVWNKRYKESDLTKMWTKKLMPVVKTLQNRVPYKNINELIDMVLNRGYEGLEINKESKISAEKLTYTIGETDTFKKAIQVMANQESDKVGDLKNVTGRLVDKEIAIESQSHE